MLYKLMKTGYYISRDSSNKCEVTEKIIRSLVRNFDTSLIYPITLDYSHSLGTYGELLSIDTDGEWLFGYLKFYTDKIVSLMREHGERWWFVVPGWKNLIDNEGNKIESEWVVTECALTRFPINPLEDVISPVDLQKYLEDEARREM